MSRVICHFLVTEHRSHAVIIRPITRSLQETKVSLQSHARNHCAVYVCQPSPGGPPLLTWPDLSPGARHRDLTCASGCSSPAPARTAARSAAGGCWSTGQGPWRWWPSGLSPAPARTRWNSGWRKYCALPAMRNKEINKKAKAPLMRRSAQLDYNRLWPYNHLRVQSKALHIKTS